MTRRLLRRTISHAIFIIAVTVNSTSWQVCDERAVKGTVEMDIPLCLDSLLAEPSHLTPQHRKKKPLAD